jgi:hypothetical protein
MIVEIPQLPNFEAQCDTCGASGPRALNKAAAKMRAERLDWKFDGDKCMCHRCLVLTEVKS